MKICMIGPSYPFRGGISHYMTLLYKELKKHHEVRFFSFKRQYPSWLYPGQTDKDTSTFTVADSGIEPLLDSMNPFTWIKIFSRIKEAGPDVVIIPWWVAFWAPQFSSITWCIKRFTKAKVLFICHNVIEHEANMITRILTKAVLRNGDFFIVHSEDDLQNLRAVLPEANVIKSHHPTYEVFKQDGWDKNEAREALGLSGKTVLFFGFVRPYKGLHYLIEAMPQILKETSVTLLIVGEFWKDKSDYTGQIERLGLLEAVKVIDKYVPNEEIPMYFAAADIVMLPYTSATGSGIVQLSFGCERPVVTTRVGSLGEVVKDGKTGFVIEPCDARAIANAVIDFYNADRESEFIANIRSGREEFSWGRMRENIERFNKEAPGSQAGPEPVRSIS